VDGDILQALKAAGCIHVVFGSESGSEATLKRMNKRLSILKNIEAIKLTKSFGLVAEANIVIGTPNETEEDFLQTINFIKEARPDRVFISKFYPLPGTQFYKQLLEENAIQKPIDWDEINYKYVETDEFTFADMSIQKFLKLRNKANREVVLWTNYMYVIRNNINKNFKLAVGEFIKMALYISFYYLPLSIQAKAKQGVGKMSFRFRYFFRK
jgi:radical SAM superfamily enzyme YgiQ (UPF0313 family)